MNFKSTIINKCRIPELNDLSMVKQLQLVGIQKEAKPFYINLVSLQTGKSLVVILNDEKEILYIQRALLFYNEITQHENQIKILSFPEYDRDIFLPIKLHENIIMERIRTLWNLINNERFILLLPVKAAARRLIRPEIFKSACYSISAGEEIPYDLFIKILEDNGYKQKRNSINFW